MDLRSIIKRFSNDRSPLIRGAVVKLAAVYVDKFMLDILIDLSADKNNMVRVEVADSLGSYLEDISYDKLLYMCYDSYYMVRGYAVYSLSDVSVTEKRKKLSDLKIRNRIPMEHRNFNKINCHIALYNIGDKYALNSIFNLYRKSNYSDKCFVLNFLIDICESHRDEISCFLDRNNEDSADIPVIRLKEELAQKLNWS